MWILAVGSECDWHRGTELHKQLQEYLHHQDVSFILAFGMVKEPNSILRVLTPIKITMGYPKL